MQPGAYAEEYPTDSPFVFPRRASESPQRPGQTEGRKHGPALLAQIQADRKILSPKLKNLADFCLRHAHGLHHMRILELAVATDNIPSTVVRFAKRYGYQGFQDFKLAFLQIVLPEQGAGNEGNVASRPTGLAAAVWELDYASSGAIALKDLVSTTSFQQAVRWIRTTATVGILVRSADDRPLALHLELLLARIHRPVVTLSEQQYLQGTGVDPVDVLFDVDIGLDRKSADYGKVLPTAKTKFVRITAKPSTAFSTNVMSHLGLFSYADLPEHLTVAGMTLMNALFASLQE